MVTTSTSYPVFLANSFPLVSYHLLKSGFCSQWVQRTSFFCCAKLASGIVAATIAAARIGSIHHPPRFMSSPFDTCDLLDEIGYDIACDLLRLAGPIFLVNVALRRLIAWRGRFLDRLRSVA